MFTAIGRAAIHRSHIFAETLLLLMQALRNLFAPLAQGSAAVRSVFLKQVYFSGLQAMSIVVTIAVLLGTVIIVQVTGLVGTNGTLAGKILVWVVLRELGPLLTAIIVIARSGTAIAAELGTMKINGEIDAIEMLGIPMDRYLILPRITGVTTSVLVLTVYFVLTSFAGSFLVVFVGWNLPYAHFIEGIEAAVTIADLVLLAVKSILFGAFISAICCRYGLSVGKSATEIPQAATGAVITSLFTVFLMDGVITYLASLGHH